MTPKEKAEELVDKFMDYTGFEINEQNNMSNIFSAKQCALIAVDEILDTLGGTGVYGYADAAVEHYWKEVKQEIEKL
jgi:hypothetical protein